MSIQTPTMLIGGNNIPASESSRESQKEKKSRTDMGRNQHLKAIHKNWQRFEERDGTSHIMFMEVGVHFGTSFWKTILKTRLKILTLSLIQ